MTLDELFRSCVASASALTSSLQVEVEHWPWTADDDSAKPVYTAAPVLRKAIVERVTGLVDTSPGDVMKARHHLVFLDPIEPYPAEGREGPLDPRDKFVVPDRSTGPVVGLKGPVDPATGFTYMGEVWLG